MSQSTLFRIAAVGLVVGALVTALASLVSPVQNTDSIRTAYESPFFYPSLVASVLGGIAIILCVPALYARQRASSGVLGLLGAILIVAGAAALLVSLGIFDLLTIPWALSLHLSAAQYQSGPAGFNLFYPISSIAVTVGGLLLGIATIRARVLGRAAGIALIVGAVLSFVLSFLPLYGVLGALGEVAYMVALAWCGVALWRSVPSLEVASDIAGREVA